MMRSILTGLVLIAAAGCQSGGGPAARSDGSTPLTTIQVSSLREEAIDLLVAATTSADAEARANAAEGLGLTPARLNPVLPGLLGDPNVGVRSIAAMSVGRHRMEGHEVRLRQLLDDPSPYVRASAIYALIRLGEPVDRSPLASILLTDPSPRVRAHAAYILGELDEPSALGLLREADSARMLRASPADLRLLRLQIAEAMVKLGDTSPVEAIRAALYPSRPEELEAAALAVQIIGEIGDRASVDQLVILSAYNEGGQRLPAEVRLAIAGSLAKLGLDGGSFIADEFRESDRPALRAQSAHVYGVTGQWRNLDELSRLMNDPMPQVRVAAAAGVIRIADSRREARTGTD